MSYSYIPIDQILDHRSVLSTNLLDRFGEMGWHQIETTIDLDSFHELIAHHARDMDEWTSKSWWYFYRNQRHYILHLFFKSEEDALWAKLVL